MTVRLMHVSDVHAGPPFDAHVAEIVLRDAHAYAPDAFVVSVILSNVPILQISGRRLPRGLRKPPPHVSWCPAITMCHFTMCGTALFDPYRAYQTHISTDLHPVLAPLAGVSLFGVNSAHGWTVDGGWVSATQLTQLRAVASTAPAGNRKVVVMHHHLVQSPGAGRRNRVANARHVAGTL
jgi:hypothetical protein